MVGMPLSESELMVGNKTEPCGCSYTAHVPSGVRIELKKVGLLLRVRLLVTFRKE
jgi:hypothetical protein